MSFAAYIRDVLEREVVDHQARAALRDDILALSAIHQKLQDQDDRNGERPSGRDPDMQARSIETLLILRSIVQPMSLDAAHRQMKHAGLTPWNIPLGIGD